MKREFYGILALVLVLLISCEKEEIKIDKKEIYRKEIIASLHEVKVKTYYCSMNCEDGKEYSLAENCPVCRLDLSEK